MKTTLALVGLIGALVACGPAPAAGTLPPPPAGATPADASEGPTLLPPAGEATTSSPDSPSGDVSAYIACEIVPPADVASLLGGTLVSDPPQEPGQSCNYGLDPGDGSFDNYIVYILPADLTATFFEAAQGELGEQLAGFGDQAYLKYEDATETYDLQVLVDGRFGLEVIGSTEDGSLAVAELFLSRMVGP